MDLIFRPTKTQYTLEEVLSEVEHQSWRVDPGPVLVLTGGTDLASNADTTAYISSSYLKQCIYDGRNVNAQAMQLSASINVFGIEKETFLQTDQFGNPTAQRNQTNATRWVIKPKWETPMLNFSSSLKPNDHTPNLPIFGSGSVPHGMWHQFGLIEPARNRGIFLEMSDIPKNWLKYHYSVRNTASVYNAGDFAAVGPSLHSDMHSLADVFKFDKTPKRLGEIARRKKIREAIVAIPYKNTLAGNSTTTDNLQNRTQKEFFGLEPFRVAAALASNSKTKAGKSLEIAGQSIRKLVRKMKKYILPPQFDFLRNPDVPPIAMYMMEFEYQLDRDDLSYIWQNLAPRNYQKLSFEESSIAHELNDSELLSAEDLMQKDVQWMIFKVKQKATGDYFKHVASQIGGSKSRAAKELEDISRKSLQYNLDFSENIEDDSEGNGVIKENTYELQYNWPYDYVSIVEGIKVDIEVMYDDKVVKTGNIIAEKIDEIQSAATESDNNELPDPDFLAQQVATPMIQQQSLNIALTQLNMIEDDDEETSTQPSLSGVSFQPAGGFGFTPPGGGQGGNNNDK